MPDPGRVGRRVLPAGATAVAGVEAARRVDRPVTGTDGRRQARLEEAPDRVSSLVFLDFRKLLSLGEQTGLGASAAYQQVRDDLSRVRAVGARSSQGTNDTTTEILLSIP